MAVRSELPPAPLTAPPTVRLSGPTAPPAPAAVRTDVAAFVGRVARAKDSDPLPAPAAVESAEAFAAAFAEVPDSRLGPAVRAFFRNGGRRCWVIPAEPPFIDKQLKDVGAPTLVREAAALDTPPTGVHAVLALDEVTLVAVPDAFPPRPAPPVLTEPSVPQRGTVKTVNAGAHSVTITANGADKTFLITAETNVRAGADIVADPFADPRLVPNAPVSFRSAERNGSTVLTDLWIGALLATKSGAAFGPYNQPDPAALALTVTRIERSDPSKRAWVELSWTWQRNDPNTAKDDAAARAGGVFVLERSSSAAFPPTEKTKKTAIVYRGTATSVSVGTEPAYYRVRAEVGAGASARAGAWASPTVPPVPVPDAEVFNEDPIATQVAAVKVCAARGDMLAVLAPPESWPNFFDDEWKQFRLTIAKEPAVTDAVKKGDWLGLLRKSSAWLGADGSSALQTHAAFWGPWVLVRDGELPDAYPADGAVCGLLARRAVERGPWASVLNLPVAGALALGPAPYGPGDFVPLFEADPPKPTEPDPKPDDPRPRRAAQALQHDGINLLARTARGFVPVGERTPPAASANADVQSDVVPVRRFFALLRRELGRVGLGLAFAPNGPALERRAVRAVEAVLEGLLRRGALVGPDARSSFQVTARSGAIGSATESTLEVEVRVRPAAPLRLLTIRLVRTGVDAFTVSEVG